MADTNPANKNIIMDWKHSHAREAVSELFVVIIEKKYFKQVGNNYNNNSHKSIFLETSSEKLNKETKITRNGIQKGC